MIDTVTFIQNCKLRKTAIPPDWKRITRKKSYGEVYQHSTSDLRVNFLPGDNARIEVSLPKLLFPGTNGRLIYTQAQLRRALAKSDALLRPIAIRGKKGRAFKRVDLTWQIHGNVDDFIFAHRHQLHPVKNRGPRRSTTYHGESILWKGRDCRITIYDKRRKDKGRKGDLIRIEVRLRRDGLRHYLGNAGNPTRPITKLNLRRCYRVLREIMWRFQPKLIPRLRTKEDIEQWAAVEKWRVRGIPVVELLLARYTSEKRRREAEVRVAAPLLKAHKVDWKSILPKRMPKFLMVRGDYSFHFASSAVIVSV